MKNLLQRKRWLTSSFILSATVFFTVFLSGQMLDPATQTRFTNPLPIPYEIDVTKGNYIEMQMNETSQYLGLTDPVTHMPLLTKVWGYGPLNGAVSFPGPTFIANSYVPAMIKWHNNLPNGHFLPVDPSLHMAHPHGTNAEEFYASGNVPTVVHLHGGKTESASDGLPEAWYTQGFAEVGNYFVKETYTYHNTQEAATLWYHDHALGITRLNVYAGLAGFYLLEDKQERDLVKDNVLPGAAYDIEVVIQDRMFDANGQLFLPAYNNDPWFGDADGEALELPFEPSVVAEFFGNFIVVNGMSWPYLDVEPRPYRFRLLNGSDSRFYVLEFGEGMNKLEFLQVGSDDGILPSAVPMDQLVIAPGERAEVVVDFSSVDNQDITLFNYGPDAPFKGLAANQTPADPATTGQIMQFRVNKKLKVNRGHPIPTVQANTVLRPDLEDLGTPKTVRKLALFEGEDSDGRLQPLLGVINGDFAKTDATLNGSLAWFEDITENPMVNDVEEWWVYNATEDAHPIHLHLVSFQILDRQPFEAIVGEQNQIQHDGEYGTGGYIVENSITHTGPSELPPPNEMGWKDTFIVPPGYVGRLKARFERPGRYVWHCHILSHEDHEMMRPFEVLAPSAAAASGSVLKGLYEGDAADAQAAAEQSQMFTAGFAVYPNPAADQAYVEFSLEKASNVNINIYDMTGSRVFAAEMGTYSDGFFRETIHVDALEDGLYIVELNTGTTSQKSRLMIAH